MQYFQFGVPAYTTKLAQDWIAIIIIIIIIVYYAIKAT